MRSTIADPDTRNADIWFFITANDASGAGVSGQNDPCGHMKQVGVFRIKIIDSNKAQVCISIENDIPDDICLPSYHLHV